MNSIDALNRALQRRSSVVSLTGFSTNDGVSHSPGPIDPRYLLTLLGKLRDSDLLSETNWEVEPEVITVNRNQFNLAMRRLDVQNSKMMEEIWQSIVLSSRSK